MAAYRLAQREEWSMRNQDAALIVTLGLLLGAGCASSPPTSFFILSPIEDTRVFQQAHAAKFGLAIGVGPIALPAYLDRVQIVTRQSPNALDLSELDQWAEPLANNIANVVGDNLSLLLATDDVWFYPWDVGVPLDYQLTLEVIHFEGAVGSDVRLDLRWLIYSADGTTMLASKRARYQEAARGDGYEELVAAMNRALNQLSRDLTEEILRLSGRDAA